MKRSGLPVVDEFVKIISSERLRLPSVRNLVTTIGKNISLERGTSKKISWIKREEAITSYKLKGRGPVGAIYSLHPYCVTPSRACVFDLRGRSLG